MREFLGNSLNRDALKTNGSIQEDLGVSLTIFTTSFKGNKTENIVYPNARLTNPATFFIGSFKLLLLNKSETINKIGLNANLIKFFEDSEIMKSQEQLLKLAILTDGEWKEIDKEVLNYEVSRYLLSLASRYSKFENIPIPQAHDMLNTRARAYCNDTEKDYFECLDMAYADLTRQKN